MKTAALKNISLLVVAMAAMVLVGCNQGNKSNRTGTTAVTTTTTATTLAGNTQSAMCTNGLSKKGRIYDETNASFELEVKDFVSASADPLQFGSIGGSLSSYTGVIVEMTIKLDANSQVIPAQSSAKISIWDSNVGMLDASGRQIKAYEITIDQALSGSFDKTKGTGTVTFKDEYGEVTFTGRLDGTYFSGSVAYKNYVSFDGSSALSGDLGSFAIARCGIGI